MTIPEHTKLNMGCGLKKIMDHWNVDIESKCNPDQVLDFENTPWPYEDNFFDRITADNVLQQLGQNSKVFANIIKEMYRVSKDGAEWYVSVPHHRSDVLWGDHANVRVLTPKTFQLFDQSINNEIINRNLSEPIYGLHNRVDIEVVDVNHSIMTTWQQQLNDGLIGSKELDMKLNTHANIADSTKIFIKIHKPGRFENLIK